MNDEQWSKHCKDNYLCLGCGGNDHQAKDCPCRNDDSQHYFMQTQAGTNCCGKGEVVSCRRLELPHDVQANYDHHTPS